MRSGTISKMPFNIIPQNSANVKHLLPEIRETIRIKPICRYSPLLSLFRIIYNRRCFLNISKRATFPFSAGFHPAPTDRKEHPEWHFHMHFYPPLLRSSTVKKFRVGYEMLGTPQRDITPEYSVKVLRDLSTVHYKKR
ncbi:MAG: hypothetical protein GVY20_00265 [Bacteroidetes bacterium]|nr:hypothetical protein [Bacteroidota bacterium]